MLDPTYYYTVYLIVVSLITFFMYTRYSTYPDSRLNNTQIIQSPYPAFLLATLMVLFIGFRPQHRVFTDMSNYILYFAIRKYDNFQFSWDTTNKIFDNFFSFLASQGFSVKFFFFIMAAMYFYGIYYAVRKLFPRDTLYAYVIYLAAFSTFSYATNGIKAGVSASFFLCAFPFYKKKIIALLFLLISIGFHHSMVLPVVAFVTSYFYSNTKTYYVIWILSIFIAAAHITFFQTLFASFSDESGAGYLSLGGEAAFASYRTGFRPDFIIYSAIPVIVGYYAVFKCGYQSKVYSLILNCYLLTNAVWMVCMYANFTNRIAYLSWLMIPFVLVYPFFDKQFTAKQYKKLNIIAWGQLCFTIFMKLIYYGYIK